jgi:hypothetical protein
MEMLDDMLGTLVALRIGLSLNLLAVLRRTIHITRLRSMAAILPDLRPSSCVFPKHRSSPRHWRLRSFWPFLPFISASYVRAGICADDWRLTLQAMMAMVLERPCSSSIVELKRDYKPS